MAATTYEVLSTLLDWLSDSQLRYTTIDTLLKPVDVAVNREMLQDKVVKVLTSCRWLFFQFHSTSISQRENNPLVSLYHVIQRNQFSYCKLWLRKLATFLWFCNALKGALLNNIVADFHSLSELSNNVWQKEFMSCHQMCFKQVCGIKCYPIM